MDVALHLGAHKTASTFIQGVLGRNRELLDDNRVTYIPLSELRRKVTMKLGQAGSPSHSRRLGKAQSYLRERLSHDSCQRLILSDENLLGSPELVMASRQLYPTPGRKLTELADILRGHRLEVFISVRGLASFTSSILMECFRTGRYPPKIPEKYREDWLVPGRTWSDVVLEIATLFPDAKIIVWNYWAFYRNQDTVLTRICGLPENQVFEKDGVRGRPSPSRDAMEDFLGLPDDLPKESILAGLRASIEAHPRHTDNPVWSLWDAEQTDMLRALFRKDLSRIAGLDPNIALLDLDGHRVRQTSRRSAAR